MTTATRQNVTFEIEIIIKTLSYIELFSLLKTHVAWLKCNSRSVIMRPNTGKAQNINSKVIFDNPMTTLRLDVTLIYPI